MGGSWVLWKNLENERRLKALDGIGRVYPSTTPARGQRPRHDLEPLIIWAVVWVDGASLSEGEGSSVQRF